MLLRYSANAEPAAAAIEAAVSRTLASGARTQDLVAKGRKAISTREMGDRVLEALEPVPAPAR